MQWSGGVHRTVELLSELNDGRPRHTQGRGHGGNRRPCRPPGPRGPYPPHSAPPSASPHSGPSMR
eukprot:931137-Prymnesium_polylepis.1